MFPASPCLRSRLTALTGQSKRFSFCRYRRRKAVRDSLGCFGTFRGSYAGICELRNRAHSPDSRSFFIDKPSACRRLDVRRKSANVCAIGLEPPMASLDESFIRSSSHGENRQCVMRVSRRFKLRAEYSAGKTRNSALNSALKSMFPDCM